jgi:lysophospholipase L1-like esterase
VSPRRLFAESLQVLAAAIVMIAAAEILLRVIYEVRNAAVDVVLLPYNAAQDFGSMPPWADGQRILEPDDALVWRNRSGVTRRYLDVFSPVDSEEDRRALLQQFLPGVPASLRDNPLWEVSLNSRGFRTDEFSTQKAPGVFRIACVGDSWTFGSNVDQRDAYPQRLGELLREAFSGASFEVLNLGTMAYSSHQGLELVRRQVLDLSPDAILVGFGMNDASVAGYRDKDFSGERGSDSLAKRTRRLLERIELVKLLRYLGRATRHESWSIGDYMGKLAKAAGTPAEAWMGGQGTESADYDELEPYTRVSPGDYERNLREIVRLARAQRADVVLLYNQLWNTPYREVVRRLASEAELAWIDSQELIWEARRRLQRDLEARLELIPATPDGHRSTGGRPVEVVFRAYAAEWEVPDALFLAGPHPALGGGVPNRVRMYDDGTHGDERAGDRVWSLALGLESGTQIFYVYTNSGREGSWEGVDVPEVRRFTVPDFGTGSVYRPLDRFGAIDLQADGWHTNAAGYRIIARAAFDALTQRDVVRRYLAGVGQRTADRSSPEARLLGRIPIRVPERESGGRVNALSPSHPPTRQ